MTTTVRAADEADAEAIAAVGVDSWREGFRGLVPEHVSPEQAWSIEEVKRRLSTRDRERRHVLVGETDGRVGGFVVIGPSRDPGATLSVGEVMALFVDPSVWRQGVGRSLVDASLAILAGDGFDAVTVWTLAESERDTAFYEALGFRPDGATQRRKSFGGPLEVRLGRRVRGSGRRI